MVNQDKIFSFIIKRQAKNVFPNDVERTVIIFVGEYSVIEHVYVPPIL